VCVLAAVVRVRPDSRASSERPARPPALSRTAVPGLSAGTGDAACSGPAGRAAGGGVGWANPAGHSRRSTVASRPVGPQGDGELECRRPAVGGHRRARQLGERELLARARHTDLSIELCTTGTRRLRRCAFGCTSAPHRPERWRTSSAAGPPAPPHLRQQHWPGS